MDSLRRGARAALTLFWSSPGLAASAVAALAMGIGFTTTMFSIVHGATRPLPVNSPEEMVAVSKVARESAAAAVTRTADYREWSEAAHSFQALAAYQTLSANLAGDGQEPERVNGSAVTANTFQVLGVRPALGRSFAAADARQDAAPVVIIGDAMWRRRFGADPAILGRMIRLSGTPHTVIGVMPARFAFPVNGSFWLPLATGLEAAAGAGPQVQIFGRLAVGVAMDAARAEIETLARTAAVAAGQKPGAIGIDIVPFVEIETPREVIRALYLMVLAVSFVLLIACSNVANLFLARAAVRSRDVAVRLALGATRRVIVLEQLAESLAVAGAGAICGLGLASAGTRVFATNTSHIIEAYWVDFRVDAVVVGFASLLAACATLGAGLAPAWRAGGTDIVDGLRDRSFGTSSLRIGRWGRGLVALQIALACGLLALTMILARSAVALRAVPWPYDPAQIATAELALTEAHMASLDTRNRFVRRLAEEAGRVPGVTAAALTTALPGRGAGNWTFALDKPESGRPTATTGVTFVTPEYFDLLGARVLAGRSLAWQDDEAAATVAVVNQSFVRRFSADRDPLGRQVFLGARALTIVGIVPDLMSGDVQETRQDGVYASMLQFRPFLIRLMARGPGDPMALVPSLREAIRRIDPDVPLQEIFTLHEAVYRDKRVLDVLSSLFLIFGVGALSLTAVGLYGIVSFAVAQRTREIGIRLALGATRLQVLRLVMAQGSRQIVIGLAAGVLLAIALSRGFAAAVEQLPPADGPLLAAIALSLGLTALVAIVIPARRAARLEIVRAIRVE